MEAILLTPTEAATRLGVSRSTVYALMNAGQLVSVHIGRSRRIPLAALIAYVARLLGDQAQDAAA